MKFSKEQLEHLAERAEKSFLRGSLQAGDGYATVKSTSSHGVTVTRGVIIHTAESDFKQIESDVEQCAWTIGKMRGGAMLLATYPPVPEGEPFPDCGKPMPRFVCVENWPIQLQCHGECLRLSERSGPKLADDYYRDESRYQEFLAEHFPDRFKILCGQPLEPVKICPDCKGTKRYVGLNLDEPCAACDGSGFVPLVKA